MRLAASAASLLLAGCSSLDLLNSLSVDPVEQPTVISYGSSERQKIDVYVPVVRGEGGPAARAAQAGVIGTAQAAATPAKPLVIFFYGGSWNSGSRTDYRFLARSFTDSGYIVAIPDYRLTPEVLYPDFLHDSAHAVSALIARAREFGADADRVILMGHSAGAYNAAMLAMDPRWLPARDRKRIRGWVGLAAPVDFLPIQIPSVQTTFHWPNTPRDTQPIEHVSPDDPPALLISADADRLVDPEQNSLALADRLKRVGVPVQVEIFKGPAVGHASLVATLSPSFTFVAPTLERVRQFIDQATK